MKLRKYPQTPHLPWSNGIEADDIVLPDTSIFVNEAVIITEKLDGEHITIEKDRCYLQYRELSPIYDYQLLLDIKEIQKKLPDDYILHGEYLRFQHEINYQKLHSYLIIYFVEFHERMLDWNLSKKLLDDFGVYSIDILYRGNYDSYFVMDLTDYCDNTKTMEGYVIRLDKEFGIGEFNRNVAKYVRKGFRQRHIREISDQKCNMLDEAIL